MFRIIAGVVLALVLTAGVALAVAPGQHLRVDLSAGSPSVERQGDYASSQPIELRVRAPRASSASVVGVGPDGSNLNVPLAREADGSFRGALRLAIPGAWSLAVATLAGDEGTTTQSFPIDVADGDALFGQAGLLFFLAAASIVAGIAVLRRRPHPAPSS
ncbi:MAG TPA: hypothetical protein VMD91_05560 [Candidatus Sulfotelmatobacter sp.]|nr:hypothetical protein [Candidatus Sulfotelmatobacter sp.]